MTYSKQIVDYLNADVPLQGLLPGGVIQISQSGRKGLNRVLVQAGFDKQIGLLKPIAVVLETKEQPTGEAIDSVSGYESTVTPELIWIYAQGDATLDGLDPYESVIEPAYNRIYDLLQAHRLTGGFQTLYSATLRGKREPDLNDAAYWLATFNAYGFRKFA